MPLCMIQKVGYWVKGDCSSLFRSILTATVYSCFWKTRQDETYSIWPVTYYISFPLLISFHNLVWCSNHSLFSVVTCASHSVGIWIIVICFYARAWTVQLLSSEVATCLMLFSFLCMLHQSFCASQGIKNDSRKLASGFAFKARFKKWVSVEFSVVNLLYFTFPTHWIDSKIFILGN